MAAHIDLSWLAGLLTKTPTAADSLNPSYDPNQSIPYTDPVTGQTSGVQPNNTPYNSPSNWQRLVHPEQAGIIDNLNTQAVSSPVSASLANNTRIGINAGNYARSPKALQVPGLSPTEAAVAGYGEFEPPSFVNNQNRSLMDAQSGVPATQSGTDVLQAGTEQKVASGEAGRVDAMNKILDQDTLNHWFTSFKITPEQARLAYTQAKFENNGIEPLRERVRELAMQNQMTQERDLVPAQTGLALTQTQNAQREATETGNLWDYRKTTMDNDAIARAALSHYVPLQDRFANVIDEHNQIHPFGKNPLGASPYAVMMQNLGDLSNAKGGDMIKDSSGKSYMIPKAPPSNIDPLTGSPSISPTITSTNGPTVVYDRSGSMAPTPEHSTTTLQSDNDPQAIRAEMDSIENSARQYPSSMSGLRYEYLRKKLEALQNISPAVGGHMAVTGGFSFPRGLQ